MKTSIKKSSNCSYTLTVSVDVKEVENAFGDVFKSIARKAKIRGFRPGKAPLELIEQQYEGEAKEEVMQNLIGQSYIAALKEHQLAAISHPAIQDVSLQRHQNFKYIAVVETEPQIKLKKLSGLKIKRNPVNIKSEEIEKTLDYFKESRATLSPLEEKRSVLENDVVVCDIEIVKDDKVVSPKHESKLLIDTTQKQNEHLKELIGLNVGDSKDIVIKEQGATYRIEIKDIQQKVLPQLDDEFAKSFGKDSLEAFKKEIQDDLVRYHEHQEKEKMKEQIFEKIVNDHRFDVPTSMVESQKKRLLNEAMNSANNSNNNLSGDEKNKIEKTAQEKAEKQVRLYFLLEKIAREEGIEVNDEDVEKRIQEIVVNTQQSEDEVRSKHLEDIKHNLKQMKTIDQLLSMASIEEQKAN